MKNRVSKLNELIENPSLYQFMYYDGEAFITFDVVNVNLDCKEITVAVTNRGRISVVTYDLVECDSDFYFEYGAEYTRIYLSDFVVFSYDEVI